MADFSAAIKYDPSLAIAYGNRGFVYYRKRDCRALADYTTQIKLKPDVLALSTAAMSIATPNSSTAPPPTTASGEDRADRRARLA